MKKSTSILFVFALLWLSSVLPLQAQSISSQDIDQVVARTMTAFQVPGIAVAVVKDGKVVHMKGYGVNSISTGEKQMNIPCLV